MSLTTLETHETRRSLFGCCYERLVSGSFSGTTHAHGFRFLDCIDTSNKAYLLLMEQSIRDFCSYFDFVFSPGSCKTNIGNYTVACFRAVPKDFSRGAAEQTLSRSIMSIKTDQKRLGFVSSTQSLLL